MRFAPLLIVLLGWPAACAAPKPAERAVETMPSAIDHPTHAMLETLARLRTSDEMRIVLRDGRTESDLRYMSLNMDLVTLDECIERVVLAVSEDRVRGSEPRTRQQFLDCLQDYFAMTREAAIGHALRRASCMPFLR